jgi:predicted negative regulator of RcsB-dependent stress response
VDTDQEEVEALREWWKENGRTVIFGLVLGIGGVFGWTAWRGHVEQQAEQASRIYEQMVDMAAADDHAEASQRAETIMSDYPDSAYASLAALLGAKSALVSDQRDDAKRRLRWVIDNADRAEVKDLARIRMARILLDEDDSGGAMATLDGVSSPSFAAIVEELRGDVFVAGGDPGAAREAYMAAISAATSSIDLGNRVQIKLDDLGHTDMPGEAQ